jgi:DNA-binding NarL/FixJ family response regulator
MAEDTTRVLLVEDHAADAKLIMARLKQSVHVFIVDRASEMSDALTALIHREFDVILLDLTLSDSHGIATVHEVSRIAPHLPIVVLSGHEDLSTAMNCVKAGASSYIVKSSEITTAQLEREVLYAKERAAHITGLRLLLHQSMMATLGNGSALAPHVDRIDKAFKRVRDYLAHNHPVALDEFNVTIEESLIPMVLRELRQFTISGDRNALSDHVDLSARVAESSSQLTSARKMIKRQFNTLLCVTLVCLCLLVYVIQQAMKE